MEIDICICIWDFLDKRYKEIKKTKKILKKEIIIAFIIGVIIASGITVYATSYLASQVTYKEGKKVEQALNELYSKKNKSAQQVATLTTQGASYKFQNDGYITGTASTPDDWEANLMFDGEIISVCPGDTSATRKVSLYVPKGTVVQTRAEHGDYNLTCYEFIM